MNTTHPKFASSSPWGIVDFVEDLAPGIVGVSTPSHGGIWLSPARQAQLPAGITPMHGRCWMEEDCEIHAAILAFDDFPNRATYLSIAIRSVLEFHPDWYAALASAKGLPNAVQIDRVDALWQATAQPGGADLSAFVSRPSLPDGTVEGQIGTLRLRIDRTGSLMA